MSFVDFQSIFTEYRRKVESGEEDVRGNNDDVRLSYMFTIDGNDDD